MNRQLNAFFKRYQALPADRQQYVLPRFVGLLQGRYGKSNASWLERVVKLLDEAVEIERQATEQQKKG